VVVGGGVSCRESDAVNRGVEEDATGEVGVGPLRERSLFLEVALVRTEVLQISKDKNDVS